MCACFTLKSFEGLRIGGNVFGKELERDEAAELDVFGLVDNTHASAAEFVDDAVMGDGLTDHGGFAEDFLPQRHRGAEKNNGSLDICTEFSFESYFGQDEEVKDRF